MALTEHQARIVASCVKRLPYSPPENRSELLHSFAEDLVKSERTRIAGELGGVIREGLMSNWRSYVLAIATRLSRGEP